MDCSDHNTKIKFAFGLVNIHIGHLTGVFVELIKQTIVRLCLLVFNLTLPPYSIWWTALIVGNTLWAMISHEWMNERQPWIIWKWLIQSEFWAQRWNCESGLIIIDRLSVRKCKSQFHHMATINIFDAFSCQFGKRNLRCMLSITVLFAYL